MTLIEIKRLMKKHQADILFVPTSDIFQNEYIPLRENWRYQLSGFSGSTGQMIVTQKKSYLFVDGRYHAQADLEVKDSSIEVVKCSFNSHPTKDAHAKLKELATADQTIMYSPLKTDLATLAELKKCQCKTLLGIDLPSLGIYPPTAEIYKISDEAAGLGVLSKCHQVLKPKGDLKEEGIEAFYVTALDSISWISNLRSFSLPNQSVICARALVTPVGVFLLLPSDAKVSKEQINEWSEDGVYILQHEFSSQKEFFLTVEIYLDLAYQIGKINKIYYVENEISVSDFCALIEHFGAEICQMKNQGIIPFHAIKNAGEIKSIESAFEKSDRAIYNTIVAVRSRQKAMSELDFYELCNSYYKKEGSLDQSFKTISGVKENSAIVHFSSPSEKKMIGKNDLLLLDSGGLYKEGFATDCTRSFYSGEHPSFDVKKQYTLVLKSLLNAQSAIFPEGTWGAMIDMLARQPLYKEGLDYKHGTGHGVGINVHEGGFRISPNSNVPLLNYSVGSIEPGLYFEQVGGVRLENIVIVEPHPSIAGMSHFRPLVFIGFDPVLIEIDMLNSFERKVLYDYECECQKKGRSFMSSEYLKKLI